MKSILVAIDFSTRSVPAIARGAALARTAGAKLTVVHIVDGDQSESMASAAEAEAQKLFEKLSENLKSKYDVDPSTLVVRGEPHAEILNAANRADTDLIVVGAHRRDLIRNAFIGTTAERSIRASNIPVLIARSPDGTPYQHPLIALDLKERDLHPLHVSKSMKIFNGTQANIVFAYDLYGNYHLLRHAGATDAELQKYIAEEEGVVRPQAQYILENAGMNPASMILKPALLNAHDPVLEAASERAADLIVVGTKRKQAFQRFRTGSVSKAIMRRAGTDVLVVPPEDL
ncbi:universal stress protein [Hyphococcus luteus]|uniref:UspA domain-containing protein n=1 Tax=Hyphococcus luteus TaxID=2058213 RepID=A0A2S7KB64_9PROT|nr:universal stress protein [Marinicaulis flavus]PQA89751.1 hypothetical protein CW354_02540 [Marinicaulis flavus]